MAAKDSNNSTRLRFLLSTLVCCLLACLPVLADYDGSYVVSVYQPRMTYGQSSLGTRKDALAHMNQHIAKYEREAEKAAKRKSQILVFPEYCLYADIKDFTRDSLENFLETIPNPKVNFPWTPCDLENTTDDTAIQRKFSCMAKKNQLYIVANVGEREACNTTLDIRCRDGRYQFNTNVVYAPNGTLVSRYRKKHLFHEPYFNRPMVAEHEVFDTPFGRFASIICFDIYYDDTLLDLIHRQKVRNIIFPNMWFNLAPWFLSVPVHASVAWATNINLISANLILDTPPDKPALVTGGSGFYSGMSGFSYSIIPGLLTVNMTSIKPDAASNFARVPKRDTPDHGDQQVHTYLVDAMVMKSVQLMHKEGIIGVCNGNLCCGLEYEFVSSPNGSVSYWLGATDFADGSRNLDVQACTVCTMVSDKMMCESIPTGKNLQFARFKRLRMFANEFKTQFVYPQVMVMDGASYQVLNPNLYYSGGEIKLTQTSPLHSMVLLCRIYPPRVSGTSHPIISGAIVIGMLVLSLL